MKQKAFGVDQSTVLGLVLWGIIILRLGSQYFFQYHVKVQLDAVYHSENCSRASIDSEPIDDCAIVKGVAPGEPEPAATRREVVFNALKCTSLDLPNVIKSIEGWEAAGSMNWLRRERKAMEFYEAYDVLD